MEMSEQILGLPNPFTSCIGSICLRFATSGSLVLEQQSTINTLKQQLSTLHYITNGVFLWKITSVKCHVSDTKETSNIELKSDAFYSHRYGYHMRVSVFLNGHGSGKQNTKHF